MRRREFIHTVAGTLATAALPRLRGGEVAAPRPTARREAGARVERQVKITDVRVIRVREKKAKGSARSAKSYLEIASDAGISGIAGDLFQAQPRRLEEMAADLRKLLAGQDPRRRELDSEWIWSALHPGKSLSAYAKGRDPLTGKPIWGTRRQARHTATGSVVMALSAVDNALWDLRGKLAGVPVSGLLGAGRRQLPAYISLLPSDKLADTRKRARELFDRGFTAQKWFLREGPPDGKEGFRRNVGLVETLRTELGREARLMFDFHVGSRGRSDWDVPYAVSLARAIKPFDPFWLEEPFCPEEIDAYERLKGETDIPLATGEHTYTRWNIQPFLDRKIPSFVQSDPEWCGGISELLKICALVGRYEGVRLIPHGHHILAAAHVVASRPEALCPMVEYGAGWMPGRQSFQKRQVTAEAGRLAVPEEPGLGPGLDWDRIERA